ncbi:hypothetical protein BC826DRAFT_576626 [Russula brevipes]|nr:hypothetical protein BC826DRAFT_576626 [Russula brevipes]
MAIPGSVALKCLLPPSVPTGRGTSCTIVTTTRSVCGAKSCMFKAVGRKTSSSVVCPYSSPRVPSVHLRSHTLMLCPHTVHGRALLVLLRALRWHPLSILVTPPVNLLPLLTSPFFPVTTASLLTRPTYRRAEHHVQPSQRHFRVVYWYYQEAPTAGLGFRLSVSDLLSSQRERCFWEANAAM